MSSLTDTTPEADRVLTATYRHMPLARKWQILGEAFQTARILHASGFRIRHPAATVADIHRAWVADQCGQDSTHSGGPTSMDSTAAQNLVVVRDVIRVLDGLAIPYALGGSMASSLYGIARFTQDADLTAEPFPGKEAALAAQFGRDYYVSLPAIQQALRDRSSFNIINTVQGFKVDVFILKEDAFERSAMGRRRLLTMVDQPEQPLAVYSPEDVVLFKLRWYRLGNESSSQQWTDIVNVLKVQGDTLETDYLDHWVQDLKVDDLLARARRECDR